MNKQPLPEFSKEAKEMLPGSIYEHFKGMRYKLLHVGRHTETLEEMVVYQALYGENGIWVRPLSMFVETVNINNEQKPRFQRVE